MLAFSFLSSAHAQQPSSPHIGYVYPAGGRQGTTFQVKLGGQLLEGATNAYVSGTGVRARARDYSRPLTPQQANALREKLKTLQGKRQSANRSSTNAFTAADQKLLLDIRSKLAKFVRRPPNPAIAENVILDVTVSPDATPGERELRLQTRLGLSNPLVFCVGQLPEFRKPEPAASAQVQRFGPRNNNEPRSTPPTETAISLPAIVNGQILPGGVDWYRFSARKGQRLLVAAGARALIPYLADAVPGWFQAALTICDAHGHELAFADHYRFHPDPVLFFEVPRDGDYLVQIRDSIYRGREDFVYRLTIGELPFLTGIFPLGGSANAQTEVSLAGWNLATNQTALDGAGCAPGIHHISTRAGRQESNPLPFALDAVPEFLEREPNNSPAAAQAVQLPLIINGRIGQPGDEDVFRFAGRAGDEIVAEIYARRLESPLDSVLELTDAEGRRLAFNDDCEDKGSGLNTHHADSCLRIKLPSDGQFVLRVADAQHQGGPEYAYRLRLGAPQPDFELRVVPSSLTVRAGASVPLTVYALRRDGFTNEIRLSLNDAPPDLSLAGARLPAGADQVRLTLKAVGRPSEEPLSLSLEGRASVNGHELLRAAVPADDMMQAFAYRHLVPAQELKVLVLGGNRWMGRDLVKVLGPTPVQIPAGGIARVRVSAPGNALMDRMHLELNEPPDGIALRKVSAANGGAELVFACDSAKTKPGTKGNLIVSMYPERPTATQKKAPANVRRFSLGTLPAIPFEVVE